MMEKVSQWHIKVAAEAFSAGMFARLGYDVSVQYGADQPEYDLVVVKGEKFLRISVKGSQDGSWGLTQSYKEGRTYHEAIDVWLSRHNPKTILCFVQFQGVKENEIPRMYLAKPSEVAKRMKDTAKGRGDTILYEFKEWTKRAHGAGSIDKITDSWHFSVRRIEELFSEA